MNREQLREDLEEALNVTLGAAAQAFSEAFLNKHLNRARIRELQAAKLVGVRAHFIHGQTVTWPSGQTSMILPDWMKGAEILEMRDVTGSWPGTRLQINLPGISGGLTWVKWDTLRWGLSGPSEDKTLAMYTLGVGPDMEDDEEEPALIPPQFHELLVWSAGIQIRRLSDERAPSEWHMAHRELQALYQMYVSKGRPLTDVPAVRLPESLMAENVLPSADNTSQDGSSIYGSGSGVTF